MEALERRDGFSVSTADFPAVTAAGAIFAASSEKGAS